MGKNKKINPVFYIAHTFGERFFVRDELIPALQKLGIKTINPFYEADGGWKENRPEVKLADELEHGGGIEAEKTLKFIRQIKANYLNIVNTDLNLIREADGLVAYMPESSTGTTCELWSCGGIFKWLAEIGYPIPEFLNKPVYLITSSRRLFSHPWIRYSTVKVFRNKTSLIKYLKKELPRIRIIVKDRRERKNV